MKKLFLSVAALLLTAAFFTSCTQKCTYEYSYTSWVSSSYSYTRTTCYDTEGNYTRTYDNNTYYDDYEGTSTLYEGDLASLQSMCELYDGTLEFGTCLD